jgi:DNA-binding beta-propeller fold protein YncE
VADYGNNAIRKVKADGAVSTFVGGGPSLPGFDDGTGTMARFYQPAGLAIDADDNLYVGEIAANRIRKVTPLGVVTTFVGGLNNLTRSPPVLGWYGVQNSVNSGNCTAWTVAQVQAGLAPGCTVVTDSNGFQYTAYSNQAYAVWLDYPWALALDAARGKLYASDGYGGTSANNIRTISLATGFTDFLAGMTGAGAVDAVGTAASFRAPSGLALDSAGGRLFVADTGNNKIRVIALASANVTTWAGGGGPFKGGNTGTQSGWLDGENVNAMFNQPYGIAYEASTQNLYVADYGNVRFGGRGEGGPAARARPLWPSVALAHHCPSPSPP